LTGFTQADGSFSVIHEARATGVLPFYPIPVFSLTQSERELSLMKAIRGYLGVGQLHVSKGSVTLTVRNLKDLLTVIIPHFTRYPCRGGKQLAFLRFKMVCNLKAEKKHLLLSVYLQIAMLTCNPDLYARINKKLLEQYGVLPSFTPLDVSTAGIPKENLCIDYVIGLIDGDGSINFSFRGTSRRVVPNVTIVAALEDKVVLQDLLAFFGCGKIYRLPSKACVFKVEKTNDILDKVWPLIRIGTFNTVKRTYLSKSYAALQILQNQGVKENIHLRFLVDLVYNMNQEGKRRKLTKTAYLDKFIN
jgi:hypothetical protein